MALTPSRRLVIGLTLGLSSAATLFTALPASGGKSAHEVLRKTSETFQEVARKASPAVVSISSIKAITAEEADMGLPFGLPIPPDDPAHNGYGGAPEKDVGVGSGVIIRSDGIVLTNNHVVENAESVTVIGPDEKRKMKARVLGADPKTDIAVLQIDNDGKPLNLPTIQFGNSDTVSVGDWAIAIGSPFGLSHSVTSGIISAKGRGQLGVFDVEDFIQTDAAINPGNSGGPLLNMDGEMIGLNAAIFSQTGGFVGIGFSIPVNLVKEIANEIVQHGRVIRGWLGVVAQDVDADLAKYFKIPNGKGALVSSVLPKSPASTASIDVGDVILKFNNREVKGSNDLRTWVSQIRSGTKVPVELIREGDKKKVEIVIKEQPIEPKVTVVQQAGRVSTDDPKNEKPSLGLALQDIPPEFSGMLGVKPGNGALIVSVQPGSAAFEAGLVPGDVILQANEKKIKNAGNFVKFAKKMNLKDLAVLYIQRGPEKQVFVPLRHQG